MIGYACINETLASQKIIVNNSCKLETFKRKGLSHVGILAFNNIVNVKKILEWNIQNNILFYRMSSDMFPWWTKYKFTDLPNWKDIETVLNEISKLAKDNNLRLTFHPGPFNKLASPRQEIVNNTIEELEKHSELMDILELSATPYNKINIHIGGVYGNKKETISRFVNNFDKLSENLKKRLTVENDDSKNGFNVVDLHSLYVVREIPIVFDYHHYMLNNVLPLEEELTLAISTWPKDITPVVHYSESKSKDKLVKAHSDYVENKIETFGHNVDIMFEAKKKELAILNYRRKYAEK